MKQQSMKQKIKYRCKGKKVIQEGEYVGRSDCKKDLTALVEALPKDGKKQIVKCPSCGNRSTVIRMPE